MDKLKLFIMGIYQEYFKDSGIDIKDWSNFLGDKKESFTVSLFLAKDSSEVANHIMGNDMFHIMFDIEKVGDHTYEIRALQKSYAIKPENQYLYYSSRNLSFRRVTGDYDKILETFRKFVIGLKKSIIEDYKNNNIHDNFIEIVKNKIGVKVF